jgi:S-DNA-T family DNA segregation ATPase FtsK/SpoIIIE
MQEPWKSILTLIIPTTYGIASVVKFLVGEAAYVIPALLLAWAFAALQGSYERPLLRILGAFLFTGVSATLLQMFWMSSENASYPGGVIGVFFLENLLYPLLGYWGTVCGLVGAAAMSLALSFDFLLAHVPRLAAVAGRCALRGFLVIGDYVFLPPLRMAVAAMVLPFRRIRSRKVLVPLDSPASRSRSAGPAALARNAARGPVAKDILQERTNLTLGPFPTVPPADGATLSAAIVKEAPPQAPTKRPAVVAVESQPVNKPPAPTRRTRTAQAPSSRENTQQIPLPLTPTRNEVTSSRETTSKPVSYPDALPENYTYPEKYTPPPLSLFERPNPDQSRDFTEENTEQAMIIEQTLATYGVPGEVMNVTRGPRLTRFEVKPEEGIRVVRYSACKDELAMALTVEKVGIEAPIPGKNCIGIDVPNTEPEPVFIRELLESRDFNNYPMRLPLAIGKSVTGATIVSDLAEMPHLLVAGATGSGKTIFVKSLIVSLLCAKTPEEMQLLLIDPKMVELVAFQDIPHLITPVITDQKKAAAALQWLVNEIEARLLLFKDARARNIEVYNRSVENGSLTVQSDDSSRVMSVVRKLPYIVCVIDELADLMTTARAEVETSIARIAQIARAVGIHLILATQRPSVDVITGSIKANFPTRISFSVASLVDSRCILDCPGAEELLGRGDMLYLPPGQTKPVRLQGAFVSDAEINRLVNYLKTQAPPQYRDEVTQVDPKKGNVLDTVEDDDPLLDQAIEIILSSAQASISMLQRRLRIGYTRAARLLDIMERMGIVGPPNGSKPRDILVAHRSEDTEAAV